MTITTRQLIKIFDTWAARHAEDPTPDKILDVDGKPVSNYGECCADYFQQIAADLGYTELSNRQHG